MESSPVTFLLIWERLIYPLIRLLCFVSIGLLVANIIESFHWTRKVSILARPLTRLGNMSNITGASFSMAFVSGVSANTMLSEAYLDQKITKRELIFATLFNSLPAYFLHLPTVFFITLSLIHEAAFIYIGITLGAAILRTISVVVISHFTLPASNTEIASEIQEEKALSKKEIWQKIIRKFKKRLVKIIQFTIPIYILIFILHRIGLFRDLENFVASYLTFLPWLTPQSIGIITLHLAAELTAGLAAAGALLVEGSLSVKDVVIALLIGNIISSPVRAIRHQFPYYAGIFKPKLATEMILYSQSFRVGSLILLTGLYIAFG